MTATATCEIAIIDPVSGEVVDHCSGPLPDGRCPRAQDGERVPCAAHGLAPKSGTGLEGWTFQIVDRDLEECPISVLTGTTGLSGAGGVASTESPAMSGQNGARGFPHRSTVAEVMTRPVVTIAVTTPYKEIVGLMTDYDIGAVPVLDGDRRVVGIVSEADLLEKTATPEHRLGPFERRARQREHKGEAAIAAELMSAPAVTIGPETLIPMAARMMQARRLKRLPVVDAGGHLVGIVSRVDLLKPFLRSDEEIGRDILDGVVRRWMVIDPATVEAGVHDGQVTLAGTLERRSDLDLLTRLIHGVDGVVGVDNRMTYVFDDLHSGRRPAEARVR